MANDATEQPGLQLLGTFSMEDGKSVQMALDGTSVSKAAEADRYLLTAQQLLFNKALQVMTTPGPAQEAIDIAQKNVLSAIATLVDPNDPANFEAIARAAAANLQLFQAKEALDPENTKKFVEDAVVSVSRALKSVCQARDALA